MRKALMRKALVVLCAMAALAAAAGAAKAAPPQPVLCGSSCVGNGGGWTGCTQATASDSGGIPYIAHYKHYLVINYCKRYGVITSVSIAAHGCETQGAVVCSTGPAWQTSGGVGYGSASFTGKATWVGAVDGVPYASTSTVNYTVPWG